jgi:hypothetical protein
MGIGDSFPGGKTAGRVKLTTHLHLVLRSKNELSYTSTPQYAFMAWCSVEAQGQLYLLPKMRRENKNLDNLMILRRNIFYLSRYKICSSSELISRKMKQAKSERTHFDSRLE